MTLQFEEMFPGPVGQDEEDETGEELPPEEDEEELESDGDDDKDAEGLM